MDLVVNILSILNYYRANESRMRSIDNQPFDNSSANSSRLISIPIIGASYNPTTVIPH